MKGKLTYRIQIRMPIPLCQETDCTRTAVGAVSIDAEWQDPQPDDTLGPTYRMDEFDEDAFLCADHLAEIIQEYQGVQSDAENDVSTVLNDIRPKASLFQQHYQEYIRGVGLGQFSYDRFADWLLENYPGQISTLLAVWLRQERFS